MTLPDQIKAWREIVDKATAEDAWKYPWDHYHFENTFEPQTVRKILDALQWAVEAVRDCSEGGLPWYHGRAIKALRQIEEKLKP